MKSLHRWFFNPLSSDSVPKRVLASKGYKLTKKIIQTFDSKGYKSASNGLISRDSIERLNWKTGFDKINSITNSRGWFFIEPIRKASPIEDLHEARRPKLVSEDKIVFKKKNHWIGFGKLSEITEFFVVPSWRHKKLIGIKWQVKRPFAFDLH